VTFPLIAGSGVPLFDDRPNPPYDGALIVHPDVTA